MKQSSEQLVLENVLLRQRIAELQAQLQFMPNAEADIWRTLADNAREYAVFQLDGQGCITNWNQGAESVFRYGAAEVIGQGNGLFFTDEDKVAGQPAETLRLAGLTGRHESEGWRVCKGGRRFWATATVIAKRDARGQLTGFISLTRDNSDHRQASEHVASANTRFQRLFRSIRQGIVFIDTHGAITQANPAVSDMLGVPREELLARKLDDPRWRMLKLSGEPLGQADFELISSEASQFFVRTHIIGIFNPQYGDHRWFQVSVDTDARAGEGVPGQVLLGLTDVTESVQAQRSLQQREGWLNGILHSVPGYISTCDLEGRLLFVNRLAPGTTHEQIIGTHFTEWIIPEYRQASWAMFQHVIATRTVRHMEQLVGVDPATAEWFDVSYSPVIVDDQVCFVTATLTPINDLKKAESVVRDSERLLRLAYDAADLGIWQYDTQRDVIHFDERAREMHGLSVSELTAAELRKRVHPEDVASMRDASSRLRDPQGSGRVSVEVRIVHPDGSVRWLSTALQGVFSGADRQLSAIVGSCCDITARKTAEIAQRESERLLRMAHDAADLGVWQYDVQRGVVRYDERARQMHGLTVSELEVAALQKIAHPEDLADMKEAFARLQDPQGSGRGSLEGRILQPDGSVRWLSVSLQAVFTGADRENIVIVGTCCDITERKLSEIALHESERLLRLAHDAADMGAWQYDVQRGVIRFDERGREMHGLTVSELEAAALFKLVHPEDAANVSDATARVLDPQGSGRGSSEGRILQPDGSVRWVSSEMQAVYTGADRRLSAIIGTCFDITERKLVEIALRASEDQHRNLLEAIDAIVIEVDRDYAICFANEQAASRLRLNKKDIIGYPLTDPALPASVAAFIPKIKAAFDGCASLDAEFQSTRSGEWFRVSIQPFYVVDGKPQRVLISAVDITPLKLAEASLQRQLAQTTMLAALSRDLAAASTERSDELLATALARLGHFLNADSAFLACVGSDGCGINAVQQWRADGLCGDWGAGALTAAHQPLVADLSQEPLSALMVPLATVTEMPPSRSKSLLLAIGARTGMIAPIHAGDRLMGIVCLHSTQDIETWAAETDAFVNRICELLASAGLRWQAERAMLELNKTLEDRVRERTAEVSDLYNNAPCGYHSLDLDSRILYINDTELRWLGYSREEAIGRRISDFVTPASVQAIQEARQQFLERGWTKDVEYDCVRRDGSILPVLVSSSAVRDAQGKIIATRATLMDDSDRRQALCALRASEARLRESHEQISAANALLSQALRVKDEFLSSMSHELRTPLTAILGLSEGLQEQALGPLTPVQAEALATIEASGRHLLNLINDILDLAKVEAGALQLQIAPVNVDAVCSASVAMIRELATRKRLTLSVMRDANAQWVRADERRLRQMLVNLLGNAVKFTPEGGSVCLEVCGDSAGNALHIAVCDSGIGIAEEDLARLFKPFVQLDSALSRQYEGTGLGLSLVMRMAQLHGGSIGVTSTPGQGSRFTIQLPWYGDAHACGDLDGGQTDALVVPSALAAAEPASGLLLLADDNPATVQTIGGYLRSHGYEVLIAHNGEQALALAHEQRPELLLLDVQMPVMDGVEALRRLRMSVDPELARMPVIALSALAMQSDRDRVLAAGATAYLSKPVGMRQLFELIGRLVKDARDGCEAGSLDRR